MDHTGSHVPHAVHFAFKLLARFFPFRPPPGKEHVRLADLKPQFARWEIPVVLLLFVCAPFTIWGARLLLAAAFPPPARPPSAVFHDTIDPMFFLLPGIFLGLILAAAPVMGIVKLLLRRRFSDYLLYGNLLVGFDTVKVWAALSAIMAVGAVVLAAAAAPVRLTLFDDRLELRHFGYSPPVTYPFQQLTGVTATTDGVVHLTFADGTTWSSTEEIGLLSVSVEQARFLAAHASGRKSG